MKDRLDPLIAERAPWLYAGYPWSAPSRLALTSMLGYNKTIRLGTHLRDRSIEDIMTILGDMLVRDVEAVGLHHVPADGAALIVANHPTGIADGIVLNTILSKVRRDAYIYANADILKVLPQFTKIIAPVEWRREKRSHAKTRETMAYTRQAVDDGRLGVIFPAGRLAKRRGLKLFERPWMASAAMIARKYNLDVIPVNIRARNSALFYLFDLIHPTLRDITLFHETLNKDRQPYRVTIGAPIKAASLPARSDDGIEMLRQATLALGGRYAPSVSLVQNSRLPAWARAPEGV